MGTTTGERVTNVEPAIEDDETELPPRYSEEAQAAEWIRRHKDRWRYDAERGRWRFFEYGRWLEDQTLRAFDLARAVARDISAAAAADPALNAIGQGRVSRQIASARNVAAIVTLARADRSIAVHSGCWDQHPMLLNTVRGVVDLSTGKMGEHQPGLYLTKLARTPEGDCPLWKKFLYRVARGDIELIAFLQRFAGYCLTGDTREHALLFLWGLGSNGKSTFVNALLGALGDYGTTAPAETFVESHAERHPTDLAMLRGARLVVVQEVEDGQRWAASKIKALTGGDRVRARFMRADYFEYLPEFKLIFCGNHKPSLRHIDEGIRRRFYLVPFTETIPAEERDADLPIKLRGERMGIMAWMLEGCAEWQRMGLAPPAVVLDATAAYFDDEDALAAWMQESCELETTAFSGVAALHGSYQAWAERAGEKFFGTKRFSQMLEERGLQRDRGGNVRGFRGLRLKQRQERLNAVE